VFDSFECAIHAIAPRCAHCGCAIVGHGMETADAYYCCAHCAKQSGSSGLRDRSSARSASGASARRVAAESEAARRRSRGSRPRRARARA
jgi:hypothetical protein